MGSGRANHGLQDRCCILGLEPFAEVFWHRKRDRSNARLGQLRQVDAKLACNAGQQVDSGVGDFTAFKPSNRPSRHPHSLGERMLTDTIT